MLRCSRLRRVASVGGRQWNLTDTWCSLCQEPYNDFGKHVGKKDHICLEMVFDAICIQPRRWIPSHVWRALEHRQFSPNVDFGSVVKTFDVQEKLRREKLLAVLYYLKRKGVLKKCWIRPEISAVDRAVSLTPSEDAWYLAGKGNDFMMQLQIPAILRLFPRSTSKQQAAFGQQAMVTYNIEQMWDTVNMTALLDISSNVSVPFIYKTLIQRGIIGELMSIVDPAPTEHYPVAFTGVEHQLAEYAVEALVTECVYMKAMEFVLRVEPAWRMYGQELVSGYYRSDSPTAVFHPHFYNQMSVVGHNADKPYHPLGSQEPEEAPKERTLSQPEVNRILRAKAREEPKSAADEAKGLLEYLVSRATGKQSFVFYDVERKAHESGKTMYEAKVTVGNMTHSAKSLTIKGAEKAVALVAVTHIGANAELYKKFGIRAEYIDWWKERTRVKSPFY